jgi:hypothetical protein
MRVVGNDSSSALLRWYQDRAGQFLPRPWMLSAPLMVYRGAMLAWSLWLALAALTWARWAWRCARGEGWWQPLSPKVVAAPAAPPPAEPGT